MTKAAKKGDDRQRRIERMAKRAARKEAMAKPGEKLLTTADVAVRLGLSDDSVTKLADEGLLPCSRTEGGPAGTGHRRYKSADVDMVREELARARRKVAA